MTGNFTIYDFDDNFYYLCLFTEKFVEVYFGHHDYGILDFCDGIPVDTYEETMITERSEYDYRCDVISYYEILNGIEFMS